MPQPAYSTIAFQSELKCANRDLLFRERELQLSYFTAKPYCIQLEATNRCNLACVYCGRQGWAEEFTVQGEMTLEIVQAAGNFLDTAYEVVIGGYGEPFMCSWIWDLTEACTRKHRCDTSIITNGSLLSEDDLDQLIALDAHRIVFSLDTASDQLFQELRGIPARLILEKMNYLSMRKQELHRRSPLIGVNVLANAQTLPHIAQLLEALATVPVQEVAVMHQKMYTNEQIKESLFQTPQKAAETINELKLLSQKLKLSVSFPTFSQNPKSCLQPMEMLFILHDGTVLACCNAIFTDSYRFILGNLLETPLETLWNAENIVAYREAFFGRGKFPEQCLCCAFRFDRLESHIRVPREP